MTGSSMHYEYGLERKRVMNSVVHIYLGHSGACRRKNLMNVLIVMKCWMITYLEYAYLPIIK